MKNKQYKQIKSYPPYKIMEEVYHMKFYWYQKIILWMLWKEEKYNAKRKYVFWNGKTIR